MTSHRPNHACRTRAFTLLEVLLTLCVLAAIAVIAYPFLERPFAGQRLSRGGDLVRAAWVRARAEAMESGRIRAFRYKPNGNVFRLEWVDLDGNAGGTAGSGTASSTNTDTASSTLILLHGVPESPVENNLPEGINFVTAPPPPPPDPTGASDGNDVSPALSGLATGDDTWSDPIFFQPDGTTSTAQVMLKNNFDRTVTVSLRGLTGVATIGPVAALDGAAKP